MVKCVGASLCCALCCPHCSERQRQARILIKLYLMLPLLLNEYPNYVNGRKKVNPQIKPSRKDKVKTIDEYSNVFPSDMFLYLAEKVMR